MDEALVGGLFALLAVVVGARMAAGELRVRIRRDILEDIQLREACPDQAVKQSLNEKIDRELAQYLRPAPTYALSWSFATMLLLAGLAAGASVARLEVRYSYNVPWWAELLFIVTLTAGVTLIDRKRITAANKRHGLQ